MKIILKAILIPALSFFGCAGYAQFSRSAVSIAAELGLPSGNFTNATNFGAGVSAKADIGLSESVAITLNGGYMNFFGKNVFKVDVPDFSYIPLKAGLKYFFSENGFAEAQGGVALPATDANKLVYAWSPGIGTRFRISSASKMEVGVRYEGWTRKSDIQLSDSQRFSTSSFVGLRIGYLLPL